MRYILLIGLLLFMKVTLAQSFHYFVYGNGTSYSNLKYTSGPDYKTKVKRGFDPGFQAGFGIASLRSSVLGAEVLFAGYQMPFKWSRGFENERARYKFSYKLFTRFDINANYAIEPYYAVNYYTKTNYIYFNKNYLGEYGITFIYKRNRLWYECQLSSFPEFDFLTNYNREEGFYRKSALHLPYLGLNIKFLLDDMECLEEMKQKRNEYYRNRFRHLRIETGLVQLARGYGISYRFKDKNIPASFHEIGIRTGFTHHPYNSFLFNSYLFYAFHYRVKYVEEFDYALNVGFESGGGFLYIEGGNSGDGFPYPHEMVFIENEFLRFVFRVGIGTGFYATMGYKF